MSLGVLSCERYDDRAGTLVPAFYLCNTIGIYAYFNDYQFFRIVVDDNNYAKGQIEIFDGNNWIITSNVKDAQIYTMDFNKLVKLLVGGSSFAYGGSGVEAACQWATMIAQDETHGYSQASRSGPNYDCSSLMYHAFVDAGGFSEIQDNAYYFPGTTYTMIHDFTAAGFTWIPGITGNPDNLYRGDILLFEGDINAGTGHTGLYLGNNTMVEASWCESEYWDFRTMGDCRTGDQTGQEIWVHSYYNFPWDGVLRYEGGFGGSGGGKF